MSEQLRMSVIISLHQCYVGGRGQGKLSDCLLGVNWGTGLSPLAAADNPAKLRPQPRITHCHTLKGCI